MNQPHLPGIAVQRFYSLVDEQAKRAPDGPIDGASEAIVRSALILLGASYGHSQQEIAGDPKSGRPEERFDRAGAIAANLRSNRFSMGGIMAGLRRAPTEAVRFPTYGMIVALIHGDTLDRYPGNANTELPQLAENNPFELLARGFEHQIDHGQTIDGGRAAATVAMLWPDDFGSMTTTPPANGSPASESHDAREPGED